MEVKKLSAKAAIIQAARRMKDRSLDAIRATLPPMVPCMTEDEYWDIYHGL